MNIRRLKHGFRIEEGDNTWHIVSSEGTSKIYTTLDKTNGDRILASLVVSRDLTERLYAEVRRSWKETSKYLNDELYAQDLTDALAMSAMASLLLAPAAKDITPEEPTVPPKVFGRTTPICRGCNQPMVDANVMLTSNPPQSKYTCESCGTFEFVRSPGYDSPGLFSLGSYFKALKEAERLTKESDGPTFASPAPVAPTEGFLQATLTDKDTDGAAESLQQFCQASGTTEFKRAWDYPKAWEYSNVSFSSAPPLKDTFKKILDHTMQHIDVASVSLCLDSLPKISNKEKLEIFDSYRNYGFSYRPDNNVVTFTRIEK